MNKKEVIRKCCACNVQKSRTELIKITRTKSGEIEVMPNTKFFGHSFYICKNENCINNILKKGKLFKMLKTPPDENLKEKIRAVLES